LDRWRDVVVIAEVVDGHRWRISDDSDGDEKDLDEHAFDVAGTAPPSSDVVNAADSSAASRRMTEQRYLAMKSAMMMMTSTNCLGIGRVGYRIMVSTMTSDVNFACRRREEAVKVWPDADGNAAKRSSWQKRHVVSY
jgi:hypothetical protein